MTKDTDDKRHIPITQLGTRGHEITKEALQKDVELLMCKYSNEINTFKIPKPLQDI